MQKRRKFLIALTLIAVALIGIYWLLTSGSKATISVDDASGVDPVLVAADTEILPTVKIASPLGWQKDEAPTPAPGLSVMRFAQGLDHPRIIYALPNGDVLVTLTRAPQMQGGGFTDKIAGWLMEKAGAGGVSPNALVLLRDQNGDGVAEAPITLGKGFSSPSGIAWANDTLYIANHDSLVSLPYKLGETALREKPHKIMDLPAGGNHWMRNIALSADGKSLYIAVGSASNVGENGMDAEAGRAAIHEVDLKKGTSRIYAVGLRNPNGMDFSPWNGELWTTVNERDMLGGDLVPDYLTDVPIGAQYGWPWIYYKNHIDRRAPSQVSVNVSAYTRWPQYALGPHVAALGLAFSKEGNRLGSEFQNGAVIARHGSWNRNPASGYDVVFVQFDKLGNPAKAKPKPVLSGFLNEDGDTRGRPTWVTWAKDGALLISDDTGGIIWRVIDKTAAPAPAIKPLSGPSLPPQIELKGDPREAFNN